MYHTNKVVSHVCQDCADEQKNLVTARCVAFEDQPYRMLICGSRSFANASYMRDKLCSIFPTTILEKTTIISGGAYGAGICAELFAHHIGCPLIVIKAGWDLYGRSAGYIRNAYMITTCCNAPERGIVVAFWDGKSRGTKHTISLAEAKDLELHVIRVDNHGLL